MERNLNAFNLTIDRNHPRLFRQTYFNRVAGADKYSLADVRAVNVALSELDLLGSATNDGQNLLNLIGSTPNAIGFGTVRGIVSGTLNVFIGRQNTAVRDQLLVNEQGLTDALTELIIPAR